MEIEKREREMKFILKRKKYIYLIQQLEKKRRKKLNNIECVREIDKKNYKRNFCARVMKMNKKKKKKKKKILN